MMFLGKALQVLGVGFQAGAAIKEGYDSAEGEYADARQFEKDAELVREQTSEEDVRLRVIARKAIGGIEADYGASGVKRTGSVLDVLAESAAAAEKDSLSIRRQGDYKVRSLRDQARRKRIAGGNYEDAGKINAISALLGGAGKLTKEGA